MMELYIETLTGTAFELRVSPFETIMSVKAKIQRLEGIPICQQHLIWQTVELDDDYCLHDYDIHNGATLKLVLAMRGGPINTRRVPLGDPEFMAEYMESTVTPDELMEKLPGSRQVTLLVFREGDQLNFFRVVDRGDGTLTPLSESLSAASMYNMYDEEEEPEGSAKEKTEENAKIRETMSMLKHKMDNLSVTKKTRKVAAHPPRDERPISSNVTASARLRALKSSAEVDMKPVALSLNKNSCLPPVTRTTSDKSKADMLNLEELIIPKPPSQTKSTKHDVSQRLHHSRINHNNTVNLELSSLKSASARTLRRSESRSNSETLINAIPENNVTCTEIESRPFTSAKRKDHITLDKWKDSIRPPTTNSSYVGCSGAEAVVQRRSSSRQRDATLESLKESLGSQRYKLESLSSTEAKAVSGLLQQASFEKLGVSNISNFNTPLRQRRTGGYGAQGYSVDTAALCDQSIMSGRIEGVSSAKLPPVKSKKKSSKSKRCFLCTKKTGLATSYICRCGNNFCAQHRYAEEHECTFDYKSEGRKLLEQSNPVVSAPKLPKI